MRIVRYILMAFGIILLASAGYDEFRGSTHEPSSKYNGYSHDIITKENNPEQFRNAMKYRWFYASMLLMAGVIAYMIDKGYEKSDPLSPEYAGNKALDDWGDAMQKEEERRKHPKP
jgi:hypothetical protein